MEWLNQTLETYLCIICNREQNNWFELLSLTEFTLNNAWQESTKISLFFANNRFYLAEF